MPSNDGCCVCGEKEVQEHHLIPVGYGGSQDGATVFLCATHHEKCHKAALILTSKKKDMARLEALFPKEDEKQRAIPIVRLIAYARITKQERMQQNQGHTLQRLTVELSPDTLQLLRILKMDSGLSNMNEYLSRLIRREANKLL